MSERKFLGAKFTLVKDADRIPPNTHGKSFKCETCSKVFYNEIDYKTHKNYHTGEKQFDCSHKKCFRRFISEKNRNYHENIVHKNEKEFKKLLRECKELEKKLNE